MGKLLSIAAPLALSVLAPGLGTAIGSGILGSGAAGAATLGNALLGAGTGALSGGGLKGAALGGLTGGIGANIGSFGKPIQGAVQPGAKALGSSGSGILGAIGDVAPGVARAANSVSSGLSNITSPLTNVREGFTDPSPMRGILGTARGIAPEAGSAAEAGARALGVSGNSMGSGVLGELGAVGRGLQNAGDLVAGGGSTFSNLASLGSLASNLGGGIADDAALKKAQKDLLAGNQQQLANLETYNPESYLTDPAYQVQLKEGEKALNRTLGAQGNVFSGRALRAASDLNRNLASEAERRAYLRWLEKAERKNELYGSNANTRAAVGIGRGNNMSSTLVNAFGA